MSESHTAWRIFRIDGVDTQERDGDVPIPTSNETGTKVASNPTDLWREFDDDVVVKRESVHVPALVPSWQAFTIVSVHSATTGTGGDLQHLRPLAAAPDGSCGRSGCGSRSAAGSTRATAITVKISQEEVTDLVDMCFRNVLSDTTTSPYPTDARWMSGGFVALPRS